MKGEWDVAAVHDFVAASADEIRRQSAQIEVWTP
jgi:hypothetical protein